jgi:hypothetical protein
MPARYGKRPAVADRAADRHRAGRAEGRDREHLDLVVRPEARGRCRRCREVAQHGAQLHARRVALEARDEDAAEVRVLFEPAGRAERVGEAQAGAEADRARRRHVPLDRDAVGDAGGDARHADHVAVDQRDGGDGRAPLGGADVQHHAVAPAGHALRRREHALDGDALRRGEGGEPARHPQQFGERLARLHLVRAGAEDLAERANPGEARRDEHHVAVLQSRVARGVPARQVVVHVEHVDRAPAAADLDAA